MSQPTLEENIANAAKALKALGHPTRLDIIISLENYEMSVGTLSDILEIDQSTVSKHLKILLDAGVLKLRRDGRAHFYQLKNPEYTGLITKLVAGRL